MTFFSRIWPLYRDPQHAVLGGVCAGIAEAIDADALLVRVATIVLFVLTFGLITVLYLVFVAVLPVKPSESAMIDARPISARSERYGQVVMGPTKHKRAKTEEIRHPHHKVMVRACIGVICLEIIALAILVGFGMIDMQAIKTMGYPAGFVLIAAPIVLLAAIVFDNTTCYVLTILLLLGAIFGIFFEAGFLDPVAADMRPGQESTLALVV